MTIAVRYFLYFLFSCRKCPPHLLSPLIKIVIEEIRKSCKKQPASCGFNSTDNAYEPLKLMQAVMAKTNEVCLRYLDNSMLCSLPTPSNIYYETSVYAVRNKRRKMEDRHVVIHDLNTMFNVQEASPSSYYAIFDGHAGHDAAAYSSAHLHQFLAENKYFSSNPEQALLDTFCKTDALFLEKCKVENLNGGTTAVVALLRPKEKTLYIAWVGDSQALLVKQRKILQCVNPHKPSREDERERIEKAGGCVMLWGIWRVNGQLAVSRAIGDADYKPHVIAIPDVREISLDGNEDFLIIACDGLWDNLSEDAAAQEVYYMIAENPDDTERVSKHLVHLARYQGSTDNISVIVVFLRDPHKIAAEAPCWATSNGPPLTTTDNMEAGLDNANNPFTNSNGSLKNLDVETDNIHLQKAGDGLLLNLTDNFKANGTDLSQDIFEKSNGTKKSSSDIHFDDGFGPETDVDAVDDAFSPVEKTKTFAECLSKAFNDDGLPKSFNDEVKAFSEGLANNNPLGDEFNPFLNKEVENRSQEDRKEEDFEEHGGDNREETPTPPVDTVHDVGGLEENPAESDSEDEWNYFKGDQAKPETLSSQPETVVETSELEDAMSQLNPNAAEFVPVSPTRSIPSPACRALINDEVIAQSPKRPVPVDIKVPNETEFETEVKSRPSDVDPYSNGHESDNEHDTSDAEKIENILNGKSIDEIPEFQPGSTPTKAPPAEEFHFGPNAAPFTPRPLDQSEAFSTKANYGDDTEQTLNTSFNDSELAVPHKDSGDPMSISFSAERGESNPFQDDEDLNRVHDLPENLDEFLGKTGPDENKENRILDDTISDLPEHDVLARLDNDQAAIQTTDLDKISQDDEKELASPLEAEHDDFVDVERNVHTAFKAPDSNLLEGYVIIPEKLLSDDSNIASLPELELVPSIHSDHISEPQPELDDSRSSPLPAQLDLRPEEVRSVTPTADHVSDLSDSKSPLPDEAELLRSKSPHPEEAELLQSNSPVPEDSDLLQSKSPHPDVSELLPSKSPFPEEAELLQSKFPNPEDVDLHQPKSPLPDEEALLQSKSPNLEEAELLQSRSPHPEDAELIQSKSPLPDEAELLQSKSPNPEVTELLQSQSPDPVDAELLQSKSPLPDEAELLQSKSPNPEVTELFQSQSPDPVDAELHQSKSPLPDEAELLQSKCPNPEEAELLQSKYPHPEETELLQSKSPLPEAELLESKSPVPIEQELAALQQPELSDSRLSPIPGQPDLQEVHPISPSPDFLHNLSAPKSPLPEEAELLQSKSPSLIEPELERLQQEGELSDSRLTSSPFVHLDMRQDEIPSVSPIDLPETKSPLPEGTDLLQSKSPVPAQRETEKVQETVEPNLDVDDRQKKLGGLESQSPVCEFMSGTNLPLDDFEFQQPKSPVCELKPTSDMLETEFNPKSEVENIEIAKSPDLLEEFAVSPVPEIACEFKQHSAESIPAEALSFDSQEPKQEEEITSSVKDDISSPIESPVKSPEPLVEESFIEQHFKHTESEPVIIEDSFSAGQAEQEVPKTEVPPQEIPSQDLLGDLICPLPSSRPQAEEPLFQTSDFHRFEASAPLEPAKTELFSGMDSFAAQLNEQFSIKTDSIQPEFAEPTVITPSEDSKVIDEVPAVSLIETLAQEPPQPAVKLAEPTESSQEAPKELPVLEPLPIVPVAPQVKEAKKEEKKGTPAAPSKKPVGKVAPSKPSTAPKTAATKPSPKPAVSSPKAGIAPKVPSKTGAPKPATIASKTTTSTTAAAPRASPKPKTAPAPKPLERKPLANGDAKPRTALTKRPSVEPPATKTTARPASTAAAKTTSPTKTTAPRPATAPRSAPKTSTSTTASKPAMVTTMTAKPRVPLASKTTTTTTATSRLGTSTATTKTTTTTANRTSLSPKTATAPPKPRTITYAAPKPRPPLTKTITKSADLEKEKKESANKLTASRTTTVTRTTSSTATSRTATTTARKTETKPLSHRTALPKTSSTTTKTTVSKKPGEIKSVTKTKTTKVEKPKENGVAPTNITEEIKEITIISNVVNESENLLKDNSPLDNKLITETNALIDVNPAD